MINSIWYHLEPSEVPFTRNKKLVEHFFCKHSILKHL